MVTCSNCGIQVEGEFNFCPSCGTKTADAGESSILGRTFNDKYRIVSELGSGSMGTVYLGEHIGLKKRVAVKVLHSDLQVSGESLRRFQREGIAAGQFSHPNAIQIFDFDESKTGVFYLAMEFVEGRTLKELIRQETKLSPAEAADLVRPILAVLAEAHRHGIVHRDLKPENIMVVDSASGERTVKVLDFGLSKLIDRPIEASMQTQVGRILGTPLYMSPEQCTGDDVDHRSDIYSVGLILFEMLTGKPPFSGDTIGEILRKHTQEPAPSMGDTHARLDVPADLDAIVLKALEKNREDRFQSASQMIESLTDVRFQVPAKPGHASRTSLSAARHGAPAARSRAPLWIGAIVVVAALVGGAAWMMGSGTGAGGGDVPRVSMKATEALSADEQRYVDLLREAGGHLRGGNGSAALASVEAALRMGCADSEAYLVRARIFARKRDDAAAIADYGEALAMDPDYAEAAVGAGRLELQRGRLDAAQGFFDRAAESDPDSAEALAGRAAVQYERAETEAAAASARSALALDSNCALAHYIAGRLSLDAGDVDAAIASLVQARRNDSRLWEALTGLGEAYVAAGRGIDAEKALEEGLELNPAAHEARLMLAGILIEGGRSFPAISLLAQAPSTLDSDPRLHVLRGLATLQSDDPADAVSSFERAVELDDEDPEVLCLLASIYQRVDRGDDAVEKYRRAIEVDDRHAGAHLDLGMLLLDRGDGEAARPLLERACALEPENVTAHYALGVLRMDSGDEAAALESFRIYQSLGGDDARVTNWVEATDS